MKPVKSFPRTLRLGSALVAMGWTVLSHPARAVAEEVPAPTLDPAFEAGLARWKKTTGIIESQPGPSQLQWRPGLQILLGFKAVEDSTRTLYFVELTTIRPPLTNAAGELCSLPWRTNVFGWSETNGTLTCGGSYSETGFSSAGEKTCDFVSAIYPVRVRVFDESGQTLQQGLGITSWDLMTNGLAEMCRVCMPRGNPPGRSPDPPETLPGSAEPRQGGNAGEPPDANRTLGRSIGGGFLSLIALFTESLSAPALNQVLKKARCAVRSPGLGTILFAALGGDPGIGLVPHLEAVSVVATASATPTDRDTPWYRLPVDLRCGKKTLTSVSFVVGPVDGANALVAGIRSIRATHPTKPQREFLVQLLATGLAREASEPARPSAAGK